MLGWTKIALILGALLVGSSAAASDRALTADDLKYLDYRTQSRSDAPIILGSWEKALERSLRSQSLDKAADGLAVQFGMTGANMRELARLWVTGATAYSGLSDAQADEHRRRYLALLAAAGRKPLVLQVAASTLSERGECNVADFDALLAGSSDVPGDAWLVASAAYCPVWFSRFLALAPGRPTAALIRILNGGQLTAGRALPLYAWLTSEGGLARVREGDRASVVLRLNALFVRMLLKTGLIDEAIAVADRLPAEQLNSLLAGGLPRIDAEADGLAFTMGEIGREQDLTINLASAMALKGRKVDAERLFASIGGADRKRSAFDCIISSAADQRRAAACGELDLNRSGPILLLDYFLHRQGEDPYPLAETFFATGSWNEWSAITVDLRCRVLSEPQYSSICQSGRDYVASADTDPETVRQGEDAAAAVESAAIPGFASLKSRYAAALTAVRERYGGGGAVPSRYLPRLSVDPSPPPFEQRSLPAGLPTATAASSAKIQAALPQGYEPVRVGRDGNRVAIISVSQNYDPVGEVSRGGYWVHLSDDSGRTWRRPLYTGLAEFFPYVVPASSALPLLNGNALDIAVEIQELDTASITYPPIGLRTRRREKGLYLHVPLAELERDSDGDGLTDIAERHLLLDAPAGEGGTPLVVGALPGGECASPSPERQAIAALLAEIFSLPTGGIIEPTDARGAFAGIAGGWRAPSNSADRPIFILGDPADYACLRPDRLMIVYSESDVDRIRRFTPDFHAVSVSKIVYNRAHDRGYVIWSSGWNGGTIRLRRTPDGNWLREMISTWIS
jgi:hypothetical protein